MIGLDTNVVLRLLTGDDGPQVEAVGKLLAASQDAPRSFYINHVVLVECAWTLRTGYGYRRPEIAAGLKSLTALKAIAIEDAELVVTALEDYEQGRADFSDYLVAAKNRRAGCAYTVSFDRVALRIAGMEPLG